MQVTSMNSMEKTENLVLQHVVPGLAAQGVADNELENVKREVSHNAIEPDHSGPSPSNALDPREFPARVNSDDRGNLSILRKLIQESRDVSNRSLEGNNASDMVIHKRSGLVKHPYQLGCNEGDYK